MRKLRLPKPFRHAAFAVAALLFFASLSVRAEESCPSSAALLGAWTAQGGEIQASFESDRVVLREKDLLRAASILRREPCKLVVRDQGLLATWALKGDTHSLRLDRGKDTVAFDRLPQVPPTLDISPLPLPPPGPVPPDKVKEIAAELRARDDRDQAAHSNKDQRAAVIADNIHYLREVVERYGWIDIPRFGKAAAAAAVFAAKHANDIRLEQVALPIAEKDARENGGGKEIVAVLVDDLLITLGHKQKYGTQVDKDEHGQAYVIPVEDPAKVDEYRKELGIPPWSDYLKKLSQALLHGAPIRIPGPDE
ncbi:MAG TPA: DUF6624 domain-containing protein [Thermoanaerobaculia bacterium]|jgi:hypothetical protein